MFVAENLNAIAEIIETSSFSEILKSSLQQQYANLEATLLRAKVLRQLSKCKVHYIIQSAIQEEHSSLAFLFSPFILANLNKTVIYNTPATTPVFNILNHYYPAAEQNINLKIVEVLATLNFYLDLSHAELNDADFIYLSIIKALCRTDVSSIFLVTDLKINTDKLFKLEDLFKVNIRLIGTQNQEKISRSSDLNIRKLLFKNKDNDYIKLCEYFSKINAELIQHCDTFNKEQTICLIEDMFYAEHIYEKISFYAEYMQTYLQYKSYTLNPSFSLLK